MDTLYTRNLLDSIVAELLQAAELPTAKVRYNEMDDPQFDGLYAIIPIGRGRAWIRVYQQDSERKGLRTKVQSEVLVGKHKVYSANVPIEDFDIYALLRSLDEDHDL